MTSSNDTTCPNCEKRYNSLGKSEDWGVSVEGGRSSIDLCGTCLCNPEVIDIERFSAEHKARRTQEDYIEEAVGRLKLLKEGKLTSEEVGTGCDVSII